MNIPYCPLDAHTAHIVHFIFEWLAMIVGVQLYRHLKKHNDSNTNTQGFFAKENFAVVLGCVLGAGIGNKLLFVIEVPQAWEQYGWVSLALGQTIVGGMIGGLIGVEIAKKIVGVRHSTGDLFVMPLAIGLSIGRIGCYISGLHDGTFGVATNLPWGVDFGDGIKRHPTQVYDILFCLVMWLMLRFNFHRLKRVSGLTFKLFFASYLLWRAFIDGIKPVPYPYWLGLSGIQWACIVVLIAYMPLLIKDLIQLKNSKT